MNYIWQRTGQKLTEIHFPLILDLVEWIDKQPRRYADVMDVWRTSCPRLPVWEDVVDNEYVKRVHSTEVGELVMITEKGRELLDINRPKTIRS
jgi:CTP-dependent riboflavin kinase